MLCFKFQGYTVKNDGSDGFFLSPLESFLFYKMKKKSAKKKGKSCESFLLYIIFLFLKIICPLHIFEDIPDLTICLTCEVSIVFPIFKNMHLPVEKIFARPH